MFALDHLVYATPDLDETIDELAHRLGVRATAGGQHFGRGTRNALLALGPSSYLEVVGPDHAQPAPLAPRWFGIDTLRRPRLVAWAAVAHDLVNVTTLAIAQGVHLGAVVAGGRTRPDGVRLAWHMTDPTTVVADGVVPFLIDWGSSEHPVKAATKGVELVSFRGEHPDTPEVRRMLHVLGVQLAVEPASVARLIATLRGPMGDVVLE